MRSQVEFQLKKVLRWHVSCRDEDECVDGHQFLGIPSEGKLEQCAEIAHEEYHGKAGDNLRMKDEGLSPCANVVSPETNHVLS